MKHKLSNHDSQSEKRKNTLKRQREFKLKTTRVTKARENVGDQVVIGFNFASDWLVAWVFWTNHKAK